MSFAFILYTLCGEEDIHRICFVVAVVCSCDSLCLILQEESSSEREEKRLLSVRVKLDEGGYGYVFSIKTTDLSVRWKCHLCDVLIIGQKHVDTHIQSKKHQVKMALPSHPASMFTRLDTKPLGKSLFCLPHMK